MIQKKYKCAKCNKEIDYKPKRLDYRKYTSPYRDYETIVHYNFCIDCWKEIIVPQFKEYHGTRVNKHQ